jgi:Ketosteroid isomerase homolog
MQQATLFPMPPKKSPKKKKPRKQPGHYCRVCGRRRANEKFSGKGHASHICKECFKTQRTEARAKRRATLLQAMSKLKERVTNSPKQIVSRWVELFNKADAAGLAELYHDDAVNHQVANEPVEGKANIRATFEKEFAAAEMVCIVENLFEDGEWAILEWKDPLGLRGCGFFHVADGKIQFQRGYWDKLSFLRQHGLPIEVD